MPSNALTLDRVTTRSLFASEASFELHSRSKNRHAKQPGFVAFANYQSSNRSLGDKE